MHPANYIFMAFGAFLAIVGIVLFKKMGVQGENSVRMIGFEFKLNGSALVIFAVGAVLFLVPVFKPIVGLEPSPNDHLPGHEEQPFSHGEQPPTDRPFRDTEAPSGERPLKTLIFAAHNLPPGDRRETVIMEIKEAICSNGGEIACEEAHRAGGNLDEIGAVAEHWEMLDIPVKSSVFLQ
jgi:hypothetical protein